jgi:hypothetical protein
MRRLVSAQSREVGVLDGALVVLGLLGVLGLGVVGLLLYLAVDFVRFWRLRDRL